MKNQSVILFLSTLSLTNAFVAQQHRNLCGDMSLRSSAGNSENNEISRTAFLSASTSALLSLSLPQLVNAEEDLETSVSAPAPAPAPVTRSITGCPKPKQGKANNCIATSNIKQLDTYSPPWTFAVSPQEAFARLKGIIKSEPYFTITESNEEDMYLNVEVKRLNAVDRMEFLIKGDDQVVIFRSAQIPENDEEGNTKSMVSDFGANRQRLDTLRKNSGGVFKLMGDGLTADSYEGGAAGKRNGVGGQLKAFYGLNSGAGYESVFEK